MVATSIRAHYNLRLMGAVQFLLTLADGEPMISGAISAKNELIDGFIAALPAKAAFTTMHDSFFVVYDGVAAEGSLQMESGVRMGELIVRGGQPKDIGGLTCRQFAPGSDEYVIDIMYEGVFTCSEDEVARGWICLSKSVFGSLMSQYEFVVCELSADFLKMPITLAITPEIMDHIGKPTSITVH